MIPEVGKYYHFWDDGKCGVGRHYIAKCEEIISLDDASHILIADDNHVKCKLIKLWAKEKKHKKWIFSPKTDVIVRCSIPKYDERDIYFARDNSDGWFSFNTTGWWQGGCLDIDGTIYEAVIQQCLDDKNWDTYNEHLNITY